MWCTPKYLSWTIHYTRGHSAFLELLKGTIHYVNWVDLNDRNINFVNLKYMKFHFEVEIAIVPYCIDMKLSCT